MKTRLLITAVSCSLLLVGCAQKEVVKPKGVGKGFNRLHRLNRSNRDRRSGIKRGNRFNIDRYGGDKSGYKYDNKNYNSKNYDFLTHNLKNIYFDVDQYTITPDNLYIISDNARKIRKYIVNGAKVKIEGNCDETGSDEYNYALGLKRAKSAKEALINRGIKPSAITIVSLGESNPECTLDDSPECYAKNRRVEFKLIK